MKILLKRLKFKGLLYPALVSLLILYGMRFPSIVVESYGADKSNFISEVQEIIQNDTLYYIAPRDWYVIENVTLEGSLLTLDIRSGGGCEEHVFVLIAHSNSTEADILHLNLNLSHDANNDTCLALLFFRLSFDLSPLNYTYTGKADVLILHLSSYHESLYYPLQNTSSSATTSDSSSISSFTSTISNTSMTLFTTSFYVPYHLLLAAFFLIIVFKKKN